MHRALVLFTVDPGPTRWGWSILSLVFTAGGCRIRWVDGGHDVWTTTLALELLDRALDEARRLDADVLVTSEIVTGKVFAGRSDTNVLDTSRACGRLTPVAEAVALLQAQGRLTAPLPFPRITTAEYTTAQWKAVLTGFRDGVTQEAVGVCVRGVVTGMPVLPSRRDGIAFAEHVDDACAIGVAGGFLARGHKVVPLPPETLWRVNELVQEELRRRKRKGDENKTKRALGLLPPKADLRRKPRSRAEKQRRATSALIAAARRT
jgi:hypothetical protein